MITAFLLYLQLHIKKNNFYFSISEIALVDLVMVVVRNVVHVQLVYHSKIQMEQEV